MAVVYEKQAKFPEALWVHQEVLKIRLKTFGPEHLLMADTLYFGSAAESFGQSAAISSQVYGDTRPDTIDAQERMKSTWQSLAHV